MTRPRSLPAVTACLLALAGCGGSHTKPMTSGATRRASTTSTTNTAEHVAVSQFAAAYVRFLDGDGIASELPDATAGVRALAGRSGSIPAARRRGTLVMVQLRPAVGNTGSYLLTARDDAHAFYAQMTLAEQHGHWLVVELTPPPGSPEAQDAARLFLRGYLPWLYGHAPLRTITAATSELLADLKAHPPRVPPTIQPLPTNGRGDRDAAPPRRLASASEHQRRARDHALVLTIANTRGRWLVTNVSSPR